MLILSRTAYPKVPVQPKPIVALPPKAPKPEMNQPPDSWSPVTFGSLLGATLGAGITAGSLGSGLTASLFGFGTAYAAAETAGLSQTKDVGSFLFATATSATASAAWAAGPGGVALLGITALGAWAADRYLLKDG